MSLLQQINERNNGQTQANEKAIREAQVNEQKPDAIQQGKDKRAAYSQMLASGDDTEVTEEPASQEEQEVFTKMEMEMAEVVNGPKVQQLFKIVDTAQDPVEGIGKAANAMITLLEQTNKGVDPEILGALGESAVEQIVEAYEEIHPNINLNEDQMAEAYSIGVQEWMTANPQAIDPDMQEYMAGNAPEQL